MMNPMDSLVEGPGKWRGWMIDGVVAVAYLAVAAATVGFFRLPAAVWPAAGVAVAAAVLLGQRAWRGVLAGSLFAGLLLPALVTTPLAAAAAVGLAAGNALAAVAAGRAMRGSSGRAPAPFDSPVAALRFCVLGAGLYSVIAALGAVTVTWQWRSPPAMLGLFAGNLAGTLVFAPLVLLWTGFRPRAAVRPDPWEVGAVTLAALTSALMLFGPLYAGVGPALHLEALLLIPLLWGGVRFDQRLNSTLAAACLFIVWWGTESGCGLYAENPATATAKVQAFLCCTGTILLLANAMYNLRRRGEEALRESEARHRRLFEDSPVPLIEADYSQVRAVLKTLRGDIPDIRAHLATNPDVVRRAAAGVRIVAANRAALELHHAADLAELAGHLPSAATPDIYAAIQEQLAVMWTGRIRMEMPAVIQALDGTRRHVVLYWSVAPGHERTFARIVVALVDVSAQKIAEEEKARLQQQLNQAQKMEAVGRLAGGVAHDFNNMLTVILGYAGLIRMQMPAGNPLEKDLLEIEKAAQKSKDITRQLLGFSRKQVIEPRPLDLNAAIADTGKALVRLIGENIELTFRLAEDLWKVRLDPSQVDQLLVNLAANAQDAMSGCGRLSVETSNVHIHEDSPARRQHPYWTPGDYVALSVRDSGSGMDPETLAHIFEPFFTTKAEGKGTGLGLATVYGIVKQNGGFIDVESAPGRGAHFRILFPRLAEGEGATAKPAGEGAPPPKGTGTILLVEDDDAVRATAKAMLTDLGYRVLEAPTPHDALLLDSATLAPVILLLTDVVMPGMSGEELRRRLEIRLPGLRVLFMSGYTPTVVARHGVAAFIQKPFTLQDLASKVAAAAGGAGNGG
jgi:signal transduction histidine kinase/CheY-like chemotaxis protein